MSMCAPYHSKRWLLLIGLIGVVIGVILGRPVFDLFSQKPAPTAPGIKLPPPPQELAKPHLDRAERECGRIIGEHLKALDDFFTDAKKNTRRFAEEALSWSSKWRLVADNLPLTSRDRHQKFIRAKFEEYISQEAQLEATVQRIVKRYVADVRSIESKMLVDLRADVADFPSTYVLAQIDANKLQAAYDEAIARAIEATRSDLRADITTELVSTIAGEVLTQVAVRVGVSAGILGTGAASGWVTLGVGVPVALIVDYIVSLVWDWYADPKGNLARDLDNKLDEMHRLIADGSTDVKGLRSLLEDFARERARVRRQAVLSLLRPPLGGTK